MLEDTRYLETRESWTNEEAHEARRISLERVAKALHEELLVLVRQERQGRHELCVRLGRLHDDGLWKHVAGSCSTFVRYAVKLGAARSLTEARQLVTLAHQLPELPILGPMFERGEVDWTKVRVAAPAVLKNPEDEPRWARDVLVLSYNALKANAQIALCQTPTKAVTLAVPLDQDAYSEHLRGVASQRLGYKLTRAQFQQLVLDAALEAGFLENLRRPPKEENGAQRAAVPAEEGSESDPDPVAVGADPSAAVSTADPPRRSTSKARRTAATPGVPTTCFLVRHCPRCEEAEVDGPDGVVPLRPERAARLAEDAWLLTEDGTLSRTIPVKVRRRVFARDRGCCQVPSCGSRIGLVFHHTGGWKRTGHDEDQLTTMCLPCHIHLHHGWIAIHGKHSTGFRYLDAGRNALVAPVATWRPTRPKASTTVPSYTRACDDAPAMDLDAALGEVRRVLERTGVPVAWAAEILDHVLPDLPLNASPEEIAREVERRGRS